MPVELIRRWGRNRYPGVCVWCGSRVRKYAGLLCFRAQEPVVCGHECFRDWTGASGAAACLGTPAEPLGATGEDQADTRGGELGSRRAHGRGVNLGDPGAPTFGHERPGTGTRRALGRPPLPRKARWP